MIDLARRSAAANGKPAEVVEQQAEGDEVLAVTVEDAPEPETETTSENDAGNG